MVVYFAVEDDEYGFIFVGHWLLSIFNVDQTQPLAAYCSTSLGEYLDAGLVGTPMQLCIHHFP
jgi:hypothetical protein